MYRMDKIREWFSYSFGGLTAMGGILSLNDWAVIIGILLYCRHIWHQLVLQAQRARGQIEWQCHRHYEIA